MRTKKLSPEAIRQITNAKSTGCGISFCGEKSPLGRLGYVAIVGDNYGWTGYLKADGVYE